MFARAVSVALALVLGIGCVHRQITSNPPGATIISGPPAGIESSAGQTTPYVYRDAAWYPYCFRVIKPGYHDSVSKCLPGGAVDQSIDFDLIAKSPRIEAGPACPVKEGETVQFEEAAKLYDRVSTLRSTKGEFETIAEYEARKATMVRQAGLASKLLVRVATYSDYRGEYDADNARFVFSADVFDDTSIDPLSYSEHDHQVDLDERDSPNERPSKYVGSNAFGVSVEVVTAEKYAYVLFDHRVDEDDNMFTPPSSMMWKLDEPGPRGPRGPLGGNFYIPVPIEEAKRMKASPTESFRFGVAFRPKEPYASTQKQHLAPTIEIALDRTTVVHVIHADLLCAVVTDGSGRVLKTMDVGY